jgi:nitrite reductase (NADH) small subunit
MLWKGEILMETVAATGSAVVSYNLGPVQRIPAGEGRVFRVRDTDIAIFRTRDGRVFATQATCPHRAGPLADGLVGAGKVVCPLHNYTFELATGQPVENSCAQLLTYPVALNGAGEIVLDLSA